MGCVGSIKPPPYPVSVVLWQQRVEDSFWGKLVHLLPSQGMPVIPAVPLVLVLRLSVL